ncbi:MAG: hypothetical protein E7587_06695 [Ruminococcaceae bacterium]|nr:hypothetical protein [Oscillospiraceae bacterium]
MRENTTKDYEAFIKEREAESGKKRRLLYYEKRRTPYLLLEYRLFEDTDGDERLPYTVGICASNGERERYTELENCFYEEDISKMFFDILVRNMVTPVALSYIYSDFAE